jgi:hypothetical protein
MAREPNSTKRRPFAEGRAADFEHEASEVLTSLGFKLTHRLSADKPLVISLQAARHDGSFQRRYGIELNMIVDGKAAAEAIERFNVSTEEDHEIFDEYWLIGQQVSTAARVMFDEASTRYNVFTLAQLTAELTKPKARASEKKARTRIGKAVKANQKNITLLIAAILQLLDEKLTDARSERPNSHEAVAKRAASIAEFEQLREMLVALDGAVKGFVSGKIEESAAVMSVNTFADGVQAWWKKGHEQILYSAFGTGIFTFSVSVCSLAGVNMHGKTVALVAGALAGGKPLVDALKGLGKGLFK